MATRSKSVTIEDLVILVDAEEPSCRIALRLNYTETDQAEVEGETVDVTTVLINSLYRMECLLTVADLTEKGTIVKDRMQADINLYKRAETLKDNAVLVAGVAQLEAALVV